VHLFFMDGESKEQTRKGLFLGSATAGVPAAAVAAGLLQLFRHSADAK
jgi:hypothetical protein